jgi:hypothetical protein
MLILHHTVAALVVGLAESPLRPWASSALYSLSEKSDPIDEHGLESERRALEVAAWLADVEALAGPVEKDIAQWQLSILGDVVDRHVAREIAVLDQIAELAPRLGAKEVLVVGPRREKEVSLTDGRQRESLVSFQRQFAAAARDALGSIDDEDEPQ